MLPLKNVALSEIQRLGELTPRRKTLTYDRGKEIVKPERLAQRLTIQIFLSDPCSPWQRGTKGLLPSYLPKGTDLSGDTQRELNTIAARLNARP